MIMQTQEVRSSRPPRAIVGERRERLVAAAIEVMEKHGVAALSHRRMAAAAGVPLATTTYYFSSLEDIMCAALEEIIEREQSRVRAHFANIPAGTSLARQMAAFACDAVNKRRSMASLSTELYAAAMRYEKVREIAVGWNTMCEELIRSQVGRERARAAVGAANWLMQCALLERKRLSLKAAVAVMAQVLPE